MILAGDEFGRTQCGNNNAYCQDNERSWVDWRLLEANSDLLRFFKLLIQFRLEHWLLRREEYDLNEEDRSLHIAWHSAELGKPDWSWESHSRVMHLHSVEGGELDNIYFIAHAHWPLTLFVLGVRGLLVAKTVPFPAWYDLWWFAFGTFFMLNRPEAQGMR
jgi:isoamylase